MGTAFLTRFLSVSVCFSACLGWAVWAVGTPASAQMGAAARDYGKFAAHEPSSVLKPDYDAINEFLGVFSERRGGRMLLTYSRMLPQGLVVLRQYRSYLETIPVTKLTRDRQLAFWLNLHNWMVIEAVLEQDRSEDLEDARGTPEDPGGPWTEKRVRIEGVLVSIHDIETKIVLAHWDDPRVLYGLYQGTIASPALNSRAFVGDTVWGDLEALGRGFLSTETHLKVRGRTARLSELFEWYKPALFGGDDDTLLAHVRSLAPSELQDAFGKVRRVRPIDFDYQVERLVIQKPLLGGRRQLRQTAPSPTGPRPRASGGP